MMKNASTHHGLEPIKQAVARDQEELRRPVAETKSARDG
jgi:hypothetical protein